jgi:hypothetical protein
MPDADSMLTEIDPILIIPGAATRHEKLAPIHCYTDCLRMIQTIPYNKNNWYHGNKQN